VTTTTEQINVVSEEQTSEFVDYTGSSKRDKWFGTDQNDRAELKEGSDIGYGGDGDDNIDGGAGNDTIEGGRGGDRLTGGKGRDRFVMKSLQDSLLTDMDTLADFKVGTDIFDGPQRISAKNILKINSESSVDFGAEALSKALNNSEFKANKAALVSFANGNYLVINDQTDGWDPMQDAIIKINTSKNINKMSIA
jgi:Ca2+-binding RTX toxin-like protein